jgi:hypothetical protein
MESDYDATAVNGWIQGLRPGTLVVATVRRKSTDANGNIKWNWTYVPMIADPWNGLILTQNIWDVGSSAYLSAA